VPRPLTLSSEVFSYSVFQSPEARLSSPRTSRAIGTWKVSQIRRSVVIVIGRPASICCQCRAEKPKLIISSWLYLCFFRRSRTRRPNAWKNFC